MAGSHVTFARPPPPPLPAAPTAATSLLVCASLRLISASVFRSWFASRLAAMSAVCIRYRSMADAFARRAARASAVVRSFPNCSRPASAPRPMFVRALGELPPMVPSPAYIRAFQGLPAAMKPGPSEPAGRADRATGSPEISPSPPDSMPSNSRVSAVRSSSGGIGGSGISSS